MSRETIETLNQDQLIGFTDKRGHAWHYRESAQGDEPNHYAGAIPVADVHRRLFSWEALSAPLTATVPIEHPGGVDENGDIVEPSYEEVTVTDPTRQVIVRPDTEQVLGVFKESYAIHQYGSWLVDNVASILDDDISIGSAGLLDGGGMAYVSIEMPDNIETPEGEIFRPHLLAYTSHNGKLATTYGRKITRVVCDNTLECARWEKGQQFKAKHSRFSGMKITKARDALGIIYTMADEFASEVKELTSIPVSHKQFISWTDAMIPMPEDAGRTRTMAEAKRAQFLNLWTNDNRVAPWAGTAWGVLQVANTWQTHVASIHKGTDRTQRNILAAATGKANEADERAMATLNLVLSKA